VADSLLTRLAAAFSPAKAVVTGTGGTGPGVYAMTHDVPLWTARRDPNALMRQAQQLFHTNPWVMAAERVISGRVSTAPWHLEDAEKETIEKSPLRDLIEKPQLYTKYRQPGVDTRTKLWRLTSRHLGLCGNAFWLKDEQDLGTRVPKSILYLNPGLMYARYRENGALRDWIYKTDPDGEQGLVLRPDEVLHFTLEPPDTGVFGIGLVEAAGMKADLTRLGDRHAGGTLGSGGRLPGIISPKGPDRLGPDERDALVRDVRTIVDLPDASKRTLIALSPLDFTATSANPKELDLIGLSKAGRDDILALWGVPPSQLGITSPVGLNSGETKGYDEAVLWQNAIQPRVTAIQETIQFGLLDQSPESDTLIIEGPSFDDEQPRYEIASKAQNLPLTNDERRALVGLDAFPPELLLPDGRPIGNAIFMPNTLVDITEKPAPPPPQLAPFTGGNPGGGAEAETEDLAENLDEVKAKSPLGNLRNRVETVYAARIRKAVQDVLAEQRTEIAKRVRAKAAHLAKKPTDTAVWWNGPKFERALAEALRPHYAGLSRVVVSNVTETLSPPAMADIDDTVERRILVYSGHSITGIAETTRDSVARLIAHGVDQGLGAAELGDLIENATTFDEARAEMIARTETALAYNESTILSGREYGVERFQAIDGDEDAVCAARNGKVFDADEALGITDHPNGTLDWVPVLTEAKAEPPSTSYPLPALTVNVPEPPAPIVNMPDIHVAPPEVYVDTTPFAKAVADIRAEITRPRSRRVERDDEGRIVRMIEE
jgi:SPP1 gp7 family putative phage head morphogenesis protein